VSYRFAVQSTVTDVADALERAVPDIRPMPEHADAVDEHRALAVKFVREWARSLDPDQYGQVSAVIAGHTNTSHTREEGWADPAVQVSLQAIRKT
jgi:hypothetical protein